MLPAGSFIGFGDLQDALSGLFNPSSQIQVVLAP
jgi:hypothetical protein